jgi:5-methylcytosine-specific restriction endonuclease McrA
LNASIMRDTLSAFESLSEPGAMAHLDYRWSDNDDWKDKVFAPVEPSESAGKSSEYDDDRVARHETPQYQNQDDHAAAALTHDSEECLVCAGIDY